MDDLKFNKIAAGFLLAGLIAMGGFKASQFLVPDHMITNNAYPIAVSLQADAGQPAVVPSGPEPILALLSGADIGAGQKTAKKCTACHVFEQGGKNKVGPGLWNRVAAQKGEVEGFAYSSALLDLGGSWDYPALNAFLYKPKAYIPGTKMNFAGLKKPADRANVIAYLRSLSDQPVALPTQTEIDAE